MKWNRHSIDDYPGELWQDWDRLNNLYCDAHPMLQSRFVRPLTEYFPADIEVLAGSRGGECAAIMLLQSSKGLIQRTYLPSQAQLALLVAPKDIADFGQTYKRCMPALTCRLDLLSIDSQYQGGLVKLQNAEATRKGNDIVINVDGEFEQYWAQRPKNLRKNISRYSNRINKELGQYKFSVVSDTNDIELAVARYGFVESRGWKGKSGTALHPSNAQGNFYRDVMKSFAASGNAMVFELWSGDVLLASRLCISNGSLLIILKTTFAEEYRKYAVGRMLLFELARYVFENKAASTIDFYTIASKDQADWSTGSRPIYNSSLYWGASGTLLRVLGQFKHFSNEKAVVEN